MADDAGVSAQVFRIWVQGRLSAHFADGVDGVVQRDGERGTVLSGAYRDDAHLQGVLDLLRGLGVAVRRFEITEGVDMHRAGGGHDAS